MQAALALLAAGGAVDSAAIKGHVGHRGLYCWEFPACMKLNMFYGGEVGHKAPNEMCPIDGVDKEKKKISVHI